MSADPNAEDFSRGLNRIEQEQAGEKRSSHIANRAKKKKKKLSVRLTQTTSPNE